MSSANASPSIEATQSESLGGRYGKRRGSTASSTSFAMRMSDTLPNDSSSITEISSNAISTLLQPPIVRTGLLPHTAVSSGHKIPTSRDIPPVTLTNIPHVEPTAFAQYLEQAGSLYEAFRRAKEGDGEGVQVKRPRGSSKSDHLTGITGHGSPQAGRQQSSRRTSGGPGRRRPLQVDPMSTVPSVYSEPDFHLENPRTFDVVSERAEIVQHQGANGAPVIPGSQGRRALAQNAILQEKLSWYMDTVEVHLISSISSASTSFFEALGSLRDLHVEAAASVSKIKALRTDLVTLDQEMALGGLKIAAMHRRRENMRKLGDAIQQLRDVTEALKKCKDQVDNGHIEEALEGLDVIEQLIAGEKHDKKRNSIQGPVDTHLMDLRSIKALAGVDGEIASLRQRVGRDFETRFLGVLLRDLRRHVDAVPADTTFQRWDNASQRSRGASIKTSLAHPEYLQFDEHLRCALQDNLEGLAASNSIKSATTAYREAVWREIKSLIRRHLPSSSDDDMESTMSASTQGGRRITQQEKSSILARNLRDLGATDAEDMLRKIYSNIGEALRRLGTQVKVVLDITSTLSRYSARVTHSPTNPQATTMSDQFEDSPKTPLPAHVVQQEELQQTLDMSNLLGQAVDIAQAQITKILRVRSDQTTHLALSVFLRYFHLNRLFADECEAVSGRGGVALKTVVNTHIKEFVRQITEKERQILIAGMDADHWEAKDFTECDSRQLAYVTEASTKDPEAWTKLSKIWSDGSIEDLQATGPNGHNVNGQTSEKKIHSATVDEQNFILPLSAITVLSGITQHEQLITGIPSMTVDITASLLEYLKLFNSRSSQLILGAGATRSAGLKNITTKHLALASQALSFVTVLTPYVREFVRRHSLGAGALMTDFDKVKRLYQEHQSGINDKLVDIMSGRAATHINAMKKIDWDATVNSQGVSPYMETLVKETATLHKVLSKHLPVVTVQMIMGPVFVSYRDQWGKAFAETKVRTGPGKARMLRDAEHFRMRLSKLDGASDIGDGLVSIVESKEITEKTELPPEAIEQQATSESKLQQSATIKTDGGS